MERFCGILVLLNMIVFSAYAQEMGISEKQFQDSLLSNSPKHKLIEANNIVQDSRVDTLLHRHIQMNKRRNGIDGYRLEIFFSSSSDAKEKALKVKTEFLTEYPDLEAYIQFYAPNFRVRIGNCRTKDEALKVRNRIKKHYPNAFRVDDIIQYPKLITEGIE